MQLTEGTEPLAKPRSGYYPPSRPASAVTPHRLNPPPPQTWDGGQLPQSTIPPQPFAHEPQLKPSCAHVTGLHAAPDPQ